MAHRLARKANAKPALQVACSASCRILDVCAAVQATATHVREPHPCADGTCIGFYSNPLKTADTSSVPWRIQGSRLE